MNERGAQTASADRDQLFREFLHWSAAHTRPLTEIGIGGSASGEEQDRKMHQ